MPVCDNVEPVCDGSKKDDLPEPQKEIESIPTSDYIKSFDTISYPPNTLEIVNPLVPLKVDWTKIECYCSVPEEFIKETVIEQAVGLICTCNEILKLTANKLGAYQNEEERLGETEHLQHAVVCLNRNVILGWARIEELLEVEENIIMLRRCWEVGKDSLLKKVLESVQPLQANKAFESDDKEIGAKLLKQHIIMLLTCLIKGFDGVDTDIRGWETESTIENFLQTYKENKVISESIGSFLTKKAIIIQNIESKIP